MRTLADLCTFGRILIAFAIVLFSITGGLSVNTLAGLYFFGWLLDNLDGYFARRSGQNGRLAKLDPLADTLLIISGVVLSAYRLHVYSPKFVVGFVAFWLIAVVITHNQAVWMLFSFAGLVLAFNAAWQEQHSIAVFAAFWALGTAVIKRRALMNQIDQFLSSIKSAL